MQSRDFCFWLQGFLEVSGALSLTERQTDQVRKHLALVFKHEIDPSAGDKTHQAALNHIHNVDPGGPKIRC